MGEPASAAAARLQSVLGDGVEKVYADHRGTVVRVRPGALVPALEALKNDSAAPFDMLVDATAVDWSTWTGEKGVDRPVVRFSLYYNLFSLKRRARLFVETAVGEGESAPSATSVYASADWAEREIFDMFGIRFAGHPDLRRILMPEDYRHFPLRKEFPAEGPDPQDFPQE